MDLLDGGWGRKTGGWRGLLEVFCCKASSWRGYFKAHLVDGNPALALQRWCKPLQRWEPPTPGCPSGCGTFQLASKGKSKGMPSWMSLLAFLCSMEYDHLSGLLWSTLAIFLPDAHEPRRHLLCPAATGRLFYLHGGPENISEWLCFPLLPGAWPLARAPLDHFINRSRISGIDM